MCVCSLYRWFIQVRFVGRSLALSFLRFFVLCFSPVHLDNIAKWEVEEGTGTTRKVDATQVTPTELDSWRGGTACDPALLGAFTSEGRNPLNESVHAVLPATRRGSRGVRARVCSLRACKGVTKGFVALVAPSPNPSLLPSSSFPSSRSADPCSNTDKNTVSSPLSSGEQHPCATNHLRAAPYPSAVSFLPSFVVSRS